ncbi:MAG: Stk1 family PASTA domain-containing Ser/Thr kinase [Actinomycetota bacterium]
MSEPRLLGDRYELGEVLGRGGMAEVRRGRDRRLGRTVAIKMLRIDHASDSTFQARFRREAQSAASLNHRNIVAVYDTGEDDFDGNRIPYIVMEYVEGRTLRDFVQERVRFTPERSIEVATSVLDALEYSHRAGIVHRDIKPGNVMITTSGDVKVMDFGIARSLAETGATLTQTAAVVGTAQYISPEQARGEAADARSDLYATGCVLYELLTGRPPFMGDSLVSVAVSHVREMPTPPSALDPSIPRDLDSIVLKSLAKDRLERYQSAYEMRVDLERCAAGIPVAADATASTQLIAGGGYGDAAYGPAATSMYDQVDEDYYPDEEEPERRGMSWGALVAAALAILAVAAVIGYLAFRGGGEPQLVRVPDLIGQTQEQAEATLVERGLVVGPTETRQTDNEDEIGTVLEQDPAPMEDVDEGTVVTLTVGVGPDQVSVPSVEGETQEDAERVIEDAGLTVGTVDFTETDDEEEQGTVLSQNPPAGEELDQGSEVDLTVGQAPEEVRVPNVEGETRDEARDTLVDEGFEVEEQEQSSSEVEEGRVIETDPPGGTTVEPGSTITIIVSTGEELVEVPDVSTQGYNESEARNILEDQAGFDVEAQVQQTCSVDAGTVIGQSPAAGEDRPAGSEVTITIAEEPDEGCEGDGGDESPGP